MISWSYYKIGHVIDDEINTYWKFLRLYKFTSSILWWDQLFIEVKFDDLVLKRMKFILNGRLSIHGPQVRLSIRGPQVRVSHIPCSHSQQLHGLDCMLILSHVRGCVDPVHHWIHRAQRSTISFWAGQTDGDIGHARKACSHKDLFAWAKM